MGYHGFSSTIVIMYWKIIQKRLQLLNKDQVYKTFFLQQNSLIIVQAAYIIKQRNP